MLTFATFVAPVARTTMPEMLTIPPLLVSAIVPALVTVTGNGPSSFQVPVGPEEALDTTVDPLRAREKVTLFVSSQT